MNTVSAALHLWEGMWVLQCSQLCTVHIFMHKKPKRTDIFGNSVCRGYTFFFWQWLVWSYNCREQTMSQKLVKLKLLPLLIHHKGLIFFMLYCDDLQINKSCLLTQLSAVKSQSSISSARDEENSNSWVTIWLNCHWLVSWERRFDSW